MNVLLIIPAFNEVENLPQTIADIRTIINTADDCIEMLVIDDCSVDETVDFLKSNDINYISFCHNIGIGGGVQAGYKYAREKGYDVAVQFDGDGQHSAKYLDALIKPIKSGSADLVIGSRFMNRDGFQSSFFRRLGIRVISHLICVICGIRVFDVTSGMRAVGKKLINLFADDYPQDYAEPESIVMAKGRGATIIEVPVIMKERLAGNSSINFGKSLYYMIKVPLAIIIRKISMR